jgi:hypothetical protein
MNPNFPPQINDKLECLETLSSCGFKHSSLKYLNRFSNGVQTRRGYVRFEKTLRDIIHDCVQSADFNLVMGNVPEIVEDEVVTTEHIYDTLSQFGTITNVHKISKSTYIVCVKTYEEAVEIVSKIDKMLIGKNVLEVYAVEPNPNRIRIINESKKQEIIYSKFKDLFNLLFYSFSGFMMFFAMMYIVK